MAAPSSHLRPVPVSANGGGVRPARGQRLRQIIELALKRRRMLVVMGKSKVPANVMDDARRALEVWMERNLWPSEGTVRGFRLYNDVLIVMPANNEGKKLMLELDELLRN